MAGGFKLLDPQESSFKFPHFVQNKLCGWAGKTFSELEEQAKNSIFRQVPLITAGNSVGIASSSASSPTRCQTTRV